jgi:cytochrome c-type biogenesis protein CcmH
MTLWLLGGALTLLIVLMLARPLMLGREAAASRASYDLEVYKDQLAELERDAARGLIGAEEARAARLEIQRRMLAAAGAAPGPAREARPALAAVLVLVLGVPFVGGFIYLALGQPELPSVAAGRDVPPRDPAELKELAALEAKAEQNPASIEDRLALADFHFEKRRFRSAAEAYRRALALSGGRPDIAALYGEALTRASGGHVGEAARKAFEQAAARDPAEVRAQYFLGLADAQAGKPRAALERWLRLEAKAAANAPWLPLVQREIARVAKEAEIDLAALRRELGLGAAAAPGTAPRGPSARDIEDAEKMPPEQRMAMIRGMVANLEARLKESPNDLEGWKRLARSYAVLEEHAKAAEAYRRASELAPDDTALLADRVAALIRGKPQGQELTPEIVALLRDLIARDENNPLALFYLGIVEAEAGNKPAAAALWRKLLARLPADAPIRDMLQKRIAALGLPEEKK